MYTNKDLTAKTRRRKDPLQADKISPACVVGQARLCSRAGTLPDKNITLGQKKFKIG